MEKSRVGGSNSISLVWKLEYVEFEVREKVVLDAKVLLQKFRKEISVLGI